MKLTQLDQDTLKLVDKPIGEIFAIFKDARKQQSKAQTIQAELLALYGAKNKKTNQITIEDLFNDQLRSAELNAVFGEYRARIVSDALETVNSGKGMPSTAETFETLSAGVPGFATIMEALDAVNPAQKECLLALQSYGRCLLGEQSKINLDRRPWIDKELNSPDNMAALAQALHHMFDEACAIQQDDLKNAIQSIAYHQYQAVAAKQPITVLNKQRALSLSSAGDDLPCVQEALDIIENHLDKLTNSKNRYERVKAHIEETISAQLAHQ